MRNLSIRLSFFSIVTFFLQPVFSQVLHKEEVFTHQDTLRGSLNPQRTWWDVVHYDITVKPDYNNKTIEGKVAIRFKVLKDIQFNSGANTLTSEVHNEFRDY